MDKRLAFVVVFAFLTGCGGGGSASVQPRVVQSNDTATTTQASRQRRNSRIRHVVILFQENRTVDNLFNGFPRADTVQSGQNSSGESIALQAVDMTARYDLDHSHKGFVTEFAGGAMNGFDLEKSGSCAGCPPQSQRAYGYVPEAQVEPYWELAREYVLGDRMFQTNEGPSFPAHQYIVSATALKSTSSPLLFAENPAVPGGGTTAGCDSPSGTLVTLIDPTTGDESNREFPCGDHPTLFDLLDQHGITWRYYQVNRGAGLWNAADAITHIRYGDDYANVIVPNTTIFTDIQNGTLPGVSWVIPTAAASDHALSTNGTGPQWVASIVNAIGSSPYWESTAIFVTWDDWGGWYDHVAPQQYNAYELGFRVPLLVISPYAKRGHVSHVQHEFGSILKFTEETFDLGSLGYTDSRADDLRDCFDFDRRPRAFHLIQTTLQGSDFQRMPIDMRPPDEGI